MAFEFQTPRGTKDILPAEVSSWHYLESTLRQLFANYNYHEIRTPAFEETELFARGIGQTTDIVQKEMYTFTDKGGKSYTLRPEMTAAVMRAYLQHHLGGQKSVQKLYYISPMFRQERPQAGRLRQFHQYGIEILATAEPLADAEVITLAVEILQRLGVGHLRLKLNSVGCPNCRPHYKAQLQREWQPILAKLCSDCQHRFISNPLRILDCKRAGCQELTRDVSPIDTFLCPECSEHFITVKTLLTNLSLPFEQDKRLVRGLDYYTKTAFEIVTDQLGAQDAICGGGRYDLLAAEIGGDNVPSVGFAAGMERLLTLLEKFNLIPVESLWLAVYLIGLGAAAQSWIFQQAVVLRRTGITCEMDYQNRSLKAQMREADKLQARFVAIVGENEIKNQKIILKEMATGSQTEIALTDLASTLSQRLPGATAE